jgi:type IV pilus assembly protein PilQ
MKFHRSILTRSLSICALAALLMTPALSAVEAPTAADPLQSAIPLINLETNEKPLDIVLQWISRRAGVNIVCNEADQPLVTMRLINVTWQEAIDQIATRYDMVIERTSDRIWELSRPPRVRMQFRDASLTVVLEALARQAGVNIVISDDIDSGRRLTMTLNGVPWQEALNVIVRATGYAWTEHNYNIIRIISRDNVQKDFETRIYHINYGDGATLSASVVVALSEDSKIVYDTRANALIMTDTASHLDAAFRLLKELDTRTREVQMEIRFVDYSTSDAKKLGFTNQGLDVDLEQLGNFNASFLPLSGTGFELVGQRNGSGPGDSAFNSAGFTFEALTTLNSTEIIQSPSLLTLDNSEAEIQIGEVIRFPEQDITIENGVTNITLGEAETSPVEDGIKIKVTPHITADGYVAVNLEAIDELNVFRIFDVGTDSIELPQTKKKFVKTNIMVRDGDTAVIGGILSNKVEEIENRIPGLGSIPILGWLFKHKSDNIVQRNLTIFITPRIVQLNDVDELEEAKLRLRERLSGLQLRRNDKEEAVTGIGY